MMGARLKFPRPDEPEVQGEISRERFLFLSFFFFFEISRLISIENGALIMSDVEWCKAFQGFPMLRLPHTQTSSNRKKNLQVTMKVYTFSRILSIILIFRQEILVAVLRFWTLSTDLGATCCLKSGLNLTDIHRFRDSSRDFQEYDGTRQYKTVLGGNLSSLLHVDIVFSQPGVSLSHYKTTPLALQEGLFHVLSYKARSTTLPDALALV